MRTVALIGDPVEHSPSPAMHRAAFAAKGLDLDYVAERVTLDELPVTFDELRKRHIGLNVTIPLKEAIVEHLDALHGDAARTGSVNTVSFADGRATGESTDGRGFFTALHRAGAPKTLKAVILGSGGAAKAVAAALLDDGAEVTIVGRNPERAGAAAEALGTASASLDADSLTPLFADADLLVNATPLGDRSPLPEGVSLHGGLTVFDLVYKPRVTKLLADARALGCLTVEGVEMLVEQGALSFQIWTGIDAPVDAMREAAVAHLDARAGV